jgi:molybdopterin-binding protein
MKLVTARTAAERLGVAYSTFKRWILTGQVRTSRTGGGHHRVSEAELERLLAHQIDAPAAAAPPDPDAPLEGLSARNRLQGFVEEVRVDGLLAQVRLRVAGQSLTAVITADAVHALKLRRGDDAIAVVKSTEVMIARAAVRRPGSVPARRRPRGRGKRIRSGD